MFTSKFCFVFVSSGVSVRGLLNQSVEAYHTLRGTESKKGHNDTQVKNPDVHMSVFGEASVPKH